MLKPFSFTAGTHRLVEPEETLRRIRPHLLAMGITRCLDITGLDTLAIPTYCATRPRSMLLQTSAGKGQTRAAAQASALMESIELHHAENPPALTRSSQRELEEEGWTTIAPSILDGYTGQYFTPEFQVEWAEGESLPGRERIQLPASSVYFIQQSLHHNSTNGLASGNGLDEATLHALYELIERDAISGVSEAGKLEIRKHCRVVDLATITDPALLDIIGRIEDAETKVVLMAVPSCVPVHTFWAVLVNHAPFQSISTLNVGYGTHASMEVAASRALTEAAQSRGIFIHGSREDILDKGVHKAADVTQSAAYEYFLKLPQNVPWSECSARRNIEGATVGQVLANLLDELCAAGHGQIYRCDLTRPEFNIAVVKVLIPTFRFNRKFM